MKVICMLSLAPRLVGGRQFVNFLLTAEKHGLHHRVHRVATAAFWRTFSHEGKITPGW
jgi:hypothetical protein